MKTRQRSSTKSWLIKSLILALALFILARIYYAATDDFRLSNITYDMPYEPAWQVEVLPSNEELHIQQILNQPYKYLGKGAQSYAFESQDGKYVLKFFKFKHLRPSWFFESLPSVGFLKNYKEKLAARKERKLYGVFRAYKLAYDVDREESGLIYIQLNVMGNPERKVTLVDKIGIEREVDLATVPFILQEKGRTLRAILGELLDKGDLETAKKRVGQILDLYASEYSKGIYDHDHGVMQNTGFIDARPIHLDVGKLVKEDAMRQKNIAKTDALLVGGKIKQWVRTHHFNYLPEMSAYIDQKIDQLFD